MRHSVITTAFLLMMTIAPNVLAKGDYSSDYRACTSNSGGNTSNLSECSHTELAKQNARLNNAYQSAMAVLPAEKQSVLKESQALWVKLRDIDCGIYYSLTGGTMDLLEGVGCELSMTLERADSLEWFAKNGSSDVEEEVEQDAW